MRALRIQRSTANNKSSTHSIFTPLMSDKPPSPSFFDSLQISSAPASPVGESSGKSLLQSLSVSTSGGVLERPLVSFQPSADLIEVGERVVKVIRAEGLCGGYIGRTDNKFCTLGVANCSVEAHKRRRAVITAGHLYIRDIRATGAAFVKPNLDANALAVGVVHRLMETKMDTGQLRDEFALIEGQEGRNDADIREARDALKKAVAFKTPVKSIPRDKGWESDLQEKLELELKEEIKKEKEEREINRLKELGNQEEMQKSLLALESGVKILQAAYVGVAKAVGRVDKEVGEKGELVEGIAQQVRILGGTY